MTTSVIIPAQTASATSEPFINTWLHASKTISATNLSGAEKVQIQYKHDATPTWISMGAAYQLTASAPVLVLNGEGEFRAVKDVTVGLSSVAINT